MANSCSVVGCLSKYYARGYCEKHWRRVRVNGTAEDRKWHQVDIASKFMRAVDKNGASVTPVGTPCWLWLEGRFPSGYGKVWWNGKTERANRVAWMMVYGQIPDGMQVLHKCDTPPCVNIEHLFLGTTADNVADRISKGRFRRHDRNRGERSGRAKLTEAAVRAIRADPRKHGPVAAEYRVDPSTICDIRHRKLWSHVL